MSIPIGTFYHQIPRVSPRRFAKMPAAHSLTLYLYTYTYTTCIVRSARCCRSAPAAAGGDSDHEGGRLAPAPRRSGRLLHAAGQPGLPRPRVHARGRSPRLPAPASRRARLRRQCQPREPWHPQRRRE